MDQQTVKFLINHSINGDKESFRKLVETHQTFVYSAAFRLLCNDYDAEEIVQETFIRVWKNLYRFNKDMRFTTWLYKIAVNLCYDKMKAAKNFQYKISYDLRDSVVLNQPSYENIEATLINKELADIIRFLTNKLTPKQKLVFTLTELEGLSVEEITTMTGLTSQKIKSNLYCAKQTIKDKLTRIEERKGSHEI